MIGIGVDRFAPLGAKGSHPQLLDTEVQALVCGACHDLGAVFRLSGGGLGVAVVEIATGPLAWWSELVICRDPVWLGTRGG